MKRLKKIGKVPVKKSSEIAFSRIGVGFEKLDRALFDPEKAYDLVAGLGVKYARIQSGWMRTETKKGVYDFAWIDSIVENLLSQGIEPWINLCYGNPLYTELAGQFFGGVGCPPTEKEALDAWLSYVQALVRHMKGKVEKFEIWNEPDCLYSWKTPGKVEGSKGTPDPREYGEFALATAKAIRQANQNAYIMGFALGHAYESGFLNEAMKTGLGDCIDAVSYHIYSTMTEARMNVHENMRAIARAYNPRLEMVQGESGTQSEFSHAGALKFMNWDRTKQAKHLLRLMVIDLATDCRLVSYFSALDMVEALHGFANDKKSHMDYGYFGVISAEFDENGIASGEYGKKPSYFALQTLSSLFAGNCRPITVPCTFKSEECKYTNSPDYRGADVLYHAFCTDDGKTLFTYWRNTELLTTAYDGTASIELLCNSKPELIDLMDGSVYEIPDEMITEENGATRLWHLPLRDYPLAIRYR